MQCNFIILSREWLEKNIWVLVANQLERKSCWEGIWEKLS